MGKDAIDASMSVWNLVREMVNMKHTLSHDHILFFLATPQPS
jgi:hypothetical protein